ncbi:sigma-E factor negative regulatory protein [Billgrantia saliphila]|uniref:sigma-E factor negative regulatory protein n=1 Tax=Billgrantia saliphila TaxID=1848458 RepID=UPI000CE394EC|nr:RseA family anti-sigma factor [Halomonas saliphila]
MSQNARESLSALMDSEGDDLELRRALKSLEDEPDAADAWRRYHLVRSLMRRDHDIDVSTDLSAGIMARLEQEPVPLREDTPHASRRTQPFARSAGIAAAVTLMVITGVQFYSGSDFTRSGGSGTELAESESQAPVGPSQPSLASRVGVQGSPVGMPLFSPATSSGAQSGVMPVGVGSDSPLFLTPNPRQSHAEQDQEQARLLQSYLDRHAEGTTYRSGDAWMPLLRASGSETLGQR